MERNLLRPNATFVIEDYDFLFKNVGDIGDLDKNMYIKLRDVALEEIEIFRMVLLVVGVVVLLMNFVVVFSSGLIISKGQQPKSTYLLLGNVSLADMMVGLSLIVTATGKRSQTNSSLCMFKIGMTLCSAMVSIFTVALIVLDRYVYILHGLYYHRYFTTTKVRISVLLIWAFCLTLGFLPATGWTNAAYHNAPCFYITLYPDELIFANSIICIIPLIIIVILYAIILAQALRNVSEIKATTKIVRNKTMTESSIIDNSTTLAIHRGNGQKIVPKNSAQAFKRSASFSESHCTKWTNLNVKSKSIHDLTINYEKNENKNVQKCVTPKWSATESDFSINTVDLSYSEAHEEGKKRFGTKKKCRSLLKCSREPSKLRAIIVVFLTSGCIIMTGVPYFVTIICYVLCENKLTNARCIEIKRLLGPMVIIALSNSVLNPIIYAWWHKGFQRSVRNYYRRCIYNIRLRIR